MPIDQGTNTPAREVIAVYHTRDERLLEGKDRLPTAIALVESTEEARETLLRMSKVPGEAIEDHDLRRSQVDLLQLCDLLGDMTGDLYEACRYELEASPRL